MTTDPLLTPILESWLDDGPTEMPDRVADAVARRIGHERQRPAWRLLDWRPSPMTPTLKLAAGIAAVLVVAMIGWNLLPGSSGGIGAPPTSTPTETPSHTPTTTVAPPSDGASPSPAYAWPTFLAAGTYRTRTIWDTPFEWSLTVPDGWQSRDVEVIRGSTLSLAFHLAGNTYSDPCSRTEADPPTAATVEALATALAAMPGFDASGPIELDGGGRYLELTARDDVGCSVPGLWADPPDSYNGAGPVGPPAWGSELPNMRVWILDIDGVRFIVSALWADAATPADLEELEAVVDSFRILPGDGQPIPLPSPS